LDEKLLDTKFIDDVREGTLRVVEDADRSAYDERALFHLLNLAREKQLFVLLSARGAPSRWSISLPDLTSRLKAVPIVEIGAPDDALLKMVMLKQFADRQLDVNPKVLEFLALHVDRSLQAATAAVEAVDRLALAAGCKINPPLLIAALTLIPTT